MPKKKTPQIASDDGDLRARLQLTALELFGEYGYDGTTAAQIATRAGVTERTFFRYFSDKREVLFDGQAVFLSTLMAGLEGADAALGPLDTLFQAFRSTRSMLENNRPFSKPRHDIIASTPALYERELAKIDAVSDALAAALVARGVDDQRAALATRVGMAAFVHAIVGWMDDPAIGLGERIDTAHREMKALLMNSD